MDLLITDAWRAAYPGAVVGMLAMDNLTNPPEAEALMGHADQVTAGLRAQFANATRADLAQLREFEAYRNYYRRFDKTYHVQLQFESVVLKGKPLRSTCALALAMFTAELQNRLLTAGHDLDVLDGPITVDVAAGGEEYTGMGARPLALRAGDMYMHDGAGIISSILLGPDDRTQLTASTRRAVFCIYAPAGIGAEAVERHLNDIAANVRLIAPQAAVIGQQVCG